MASLNTDQLSSFGQLALKLDHDFSELERLSGQIERLEIDSENGFERAMKLLPLFAQHGQSITEGIRDFAQALEEARVRSEKAAKLVAEKALSVQHRKEEQDSLEQRLGRLASRVREVSEGLSAFRKGPESSGDLKDQVPQQVTLLESNLAEFTDEVQAIREQARQSRLKGIERNAESLFGTLQSARRKLSSVAPTVH